MSQAGYAVRPLLLIRTVHGPKTSHSRIPTAVLRGTGDCCGISRGGLTTTDQRPIPAPTQHAQRGSGLVTYQPRLPASVTAILERRGTSDCLRLAGIPGTDRYRPQNCRSRQSSAGNQRGNDRRRSPRSPSTHDSDAKRRYKGNSYSRSNSHSTGSGKCTEASRTETWKTRGTTSAAGFSAQRGHAGTPGTLSWRSPGFCSSANRGLHPILERTGQCWPCLAESLQTARTIPMGQTATRSNGSRPCRTAGNWHDASNAR